MTPVYNDANINVEWDDEIRVFRIKHPPSEAVTLYFPEDVSRQIHDNPRAEKVTNPAMIAMSQYLEGINYERNQILRDVPA